MRKTLENVLSFWTLDPKLEQGLTEFFTYSGYLIKTGARNDYQATKMGGVWDTDSGDEDVRRRAIPLLSATAKRLLLEFWHKRGIPEEVLPFARS